MLTPVPTHLLHYVWADALPYIQLAVDESNDKITATDILMKCLDGHYVLWVWVENDKSIAAFVTQIVEYPQRKSLSIPFIGGESHRMDTWFDASLAVFEGYAKEHKCDLVEGYGRRAWLKHIQPRGFRIGYIVFEKDLRSLSQGSSNPNFSKGP